VSPILILIATQVVVVFLGCFMECSSIVMITAPIFFPLVSALGFDTLWYAVTLLLNIQLGLITPPFGLDVYTLKAMAPPDVSVGDVFRSSMPFCAIGYLVIALIMIFPQLALWLPSMMAR
jgi:TRAP-type mannitol/chloroaromatic compound transport system permease large subunit